MNRTTFKYVENLWYMYIYIYRERERERERERTNQGKCIGIQIISETRFLDKFFELFKPG